MSDEIDSWLADLTTALDVADLDVPRDVLLDLARDAAHGVARPAAPLTTFVLGVAVARHGIDAETLADRVREVLQSGDYSSSVR